MKSRSSKGFFFVLISFMLIMYIFLYLTAWINAMEISEKTASEKFRASSIDGIVSQLSDERFSNFFDIAGYYALYRINAHASDIAHPLKYDDRERLKYLGNAFFNATLYGGSQDFDGTDLNYTSAEKDTYTFGAWLENLNGTLSQAGLEVVDFEVYGLNFTQEDPVTFNATMNISIYVRDRLSTVSVRRMFALSRQFNVSGFADPMIKREYSKINSTANVEKQIFYSDQAPDTLAPLWVANGTSGHGFFYGTMIRATDVTSSYPLIEMRSQYIIVGNYTEIDAADPTHSRFGGYIITNAPVMYQDANCPSPKSESETFMAITYVQRSGACVEEVKDDAPRPFAVIPDFNMSAFLGPGTGARHDALIIANRTLDEVRTTPELKYDGARAYDIEKLRDATVCAYFLHSPRGPSYPQRLSKNALTLHDENFGMETLLVGKWAGGMDSPDYDNRSRVDFEFFQPTLDAVKVRGMPGCKSFEMCSAVVGDNAPLGHFRMSADSLTAYGISGTQYIACDDNRARCD